MVIAEQVKIGLRRQVVIPKKLRKKLNIENNVILETKETAQGLLLKPCNPVAEFKGPGKNDSGEPLAYQKNFETNSLPKMKKALNTNTLIYFQKGIKPQANKVEKLL